MSFSIQTNVNSLVAQENLRVNSNFQSQTIQRLTSGYRINSSADDAAGLAVANKFRADTAELTQGVRNANDGVAQLQIIDGGLNNISKMLDRMKTLATQSASTTFTGDRDTLDAEYQKLTAEITRQANNIGLASGSAFNKQIDIYTGGASTQANAKVSIDLSGLASAVDSNSLSLTGNIKGGSAVNLGALKTSPSGSFLSGSATETFTFDIEGAGAQVVVNVNGSASGITRDDALNQLNQGLSNYGVTASFVDDTLAFTSTKAFGVKESGTSALATGGATAYNSALYNIKGNFAGPVTNGDELTFTDSTGKSVVVTMAAASETNTAAIITKLNNSFTAAGMDLHALADTTTGANGFMIESTKTFSVARTGTVTSNFGGAIGNTAGNKTVSGPAVNASTTANALAALTAIGAATTKLGQVQGTVGAGQNTLSYAISLAQSQISNYSAAESRIRDADVAAEAANLTKAQVLQQASMAAMAQANSAPQAVLALLRG